MVSLFIVVRLDNESVRLQRIRLHVQFYGYRIVIGYRNSLKRQHLKELATGEIFLLLFDVHRQMIMASQKYQEKDDSMVEKG